MDFSVMQVHQAVIATVVSKDKLGEGSGLNISTESIYLGGYLKPRVTTQGRQGACCKRMVTF